MKFLILSSDFGTDCDSVATAVCEAVTGVGIECILADPAVFTANEKNYYVRLMRSFYGAMHILTPRGRRQGKITDTLYPLSVFLKNLNDCIVDEGFDAVISADRTVTETLSGKGTAAPFYAVLTDYNCPDIKQNAPFDAYFIPDEGMRGELIAKNIPSEKITAFGVPVPTRFKKKLGKRAARNYLVIPEKKKMYLVLASGMTGESASEICDGLLRTESGDFTVYCFVGRESDTNDALSSRYAGNDRIQIITYTEKINIYMEAADVVISHPLGILSAEAAAATVPLVHISPKSGLDRTAEFFSAHEMALKSLDVRDAVRKAKRLLENSALTERMKKIQQMNFSADSAERIVGKIAELIGKQRVKILNR